jgi:hypothetical protein
LPAQPFEIVLSSEFIREGTDIEPLQQVDCNRALAVPKHEGFVKQGRHLGIQ